MTKIYCDNCGKKAIGTGFGYDVCLSPTCDAELTIKASKERYAYPYSSWIPTKEQIKDLI